MINVGNIFNKHLMPTLVPALLLAALTSLHWLMAPTIEQMQLKVFDVFQQLKPRSYEAAPVVIVDINDESLSRVGQWPWPRTRIAEMINKLDALGASVITFDIVFAEPDRTSPKQIVSLMPAAAEFDALREQIEKLPDHDQLLAEAIKNSTVVTGFSFTHEKNDVIPVRNPESGIAFGGDDPSRFLYKYRGAVSNLPVIEKAAAGNGSFTIHPERDGIVRRVPLFFLYNDDRYPSLAAEAVRVATGAIGYKVEASGASGEASYGSHTGITSMRIGRTTIPTDDVGRILLYDTGYRPKRFVSAWDVLSGTIDKKLIEGKIVFVGTSATGLKDLRTTPISPVAAGVEVQAQLTEQILLQNFLRRPDWALGVEVSFLVIVGTFLIASMRRLGAAWCAVIGLASVIAVIWFSWYAFSAHQWLVDPILPSIACFGIYLTASLLNFLRTESEKHHIRKAFGHYMSPVLVEQLANDPSRLKLGGEMKNITVLFADIRGFTAISEHFNAQELTSFINRFLTPMTGLILEGKGTIDKYMGDAIMAFWNAPLDDRAHAANACQAALNMKHHLVDWNKELRQESEESGKKHFPIAIGIGLNTGNCCVGNMGSEQRFDYSVLGDEVNLSSRLEGQCKVYGVDIVIGQNTKEEAGDFATLELDLVRVKGKQKPVHIFGLIGDTAFGSSAEFQVLSEHHQRLLDSYRTQDWDRALACIDECWKLDTPKTRLRHLYTLYRERIKVFQSAPPEADWAGITTALSK